MVQGLLDFILYLTMCLPIPPLKPLRLASPRDILRIGVVAASGFRYSPVFDWERPYHEKYPEDTLLSYRQEFASVIKSPEHVVLVAVDKYQPDEAKKSKAHIPPETGVELPAEGDEVVVGVACWKLEPGSKRIGKFQNETGPYPELPPNLDRDKHLGHANLFSHSAEAAEKKYFHGYASMDMVVVHPAYWGHGHGGNLVKWGMNLARIDKVKYGVIAAKMGTDLYRELGWQHLTDVRLEGDEVTPQGVEVAVMEYDPTTEAH